MNTDYGSDKTPIHNLLVQLAEKVLETPVDPKQSLVAHGLDSLLAEELLEAIRTHGYNVEYGLLLDDVSIDSLSATLKQTNIDTLTKSAPELTQNLIPLTGPQILWCELEKQGWGSWANISICISMPSATIAAAFIPGIIQSLCDSNDAMRMILHKANGQYYQQVIPNFQLSVEMQEAPSLERDVKRLIEDFEGKEVSPFTASTRALVLAASEKRGRHWLCITMHHIFADRVSMQNLTRQLQQMLANNKQRFEKQNDIDFIDFALWQHRVLDSKETKDSSKKLNDLLAGAELSEKRPEPKLINATELDLGSIPASSSLKPVQTEAIELLAIKLETTTPLLFHALFSVLMSKLLGDDRAVSGKKDMLLCHVVSNRESHSALRKLVGCFDTSIPVAVRLTPQETLKSLCVRTRQAFAESHRVSANLPRGEWFNSKNEENGQTSLFEKIPHINIVRSPQGNDEVNDIKVHPVRRIQKTRWGLLLRVNLPASTKNVRSEQSSGMTINAFAEHRPLAILANHCFSALLLELLSKPAESAQRLDVNELVDEIIERAAFASNQVRRTSEQTIANDTDEAFIWDKLVARQQRWYKHNARRELVRDELNRFVGTAANPFPFTQLDKLKERQFLESLDFPLPKLLHVIPKEDLQKRLIELAPTLPESFVIKPVGAGHSFGVTLIHGGMDLTRHGVPFDAEKIADELSDMANRGYCIHQDHTFRFNFSSFLIEELVIDENNFNTPTDYKVFMSGERLLWIQLHFKEAGHTWVAFVDVNFKLLPQPAWNPTICWRTHAALVCTDQEMVNARKPSCLTDIVNHSKRLGEHTNIFVRIDWYADKNYGPLMGEITTFPHMLQPRAFYSAWANETVAKVWNAPDGGAPVKLENTLTNAELLKRTNQGLSSKNASLEDFIPSQHTPWALGSDLSYDVLKQYVSNFDLTPWGVSGADCVALLVDNGIELGGLLLATMNRYVAMPLGTSHPNNLAVTQLQESDAKALLVITETEDAHRAHDIAQQIDGLIVIELISDKFLKLPSLPKPPKSIKKSCTTAKLGASEKVLILRTSGTTGAPKVVSFTLSRLLLAGAGISQSLQLTQRDIGISMLPLHHIGGISCNLIAPMLVSAPMHFHKAFDPRTFFEFLNESNNASWCYLVSTMWEMVLEYANSHSDLKENKPWSNLRLIRSAGSDLTHKVASELNQLFGEQVSILPTYGMTEAMPIAAPPASYKLEIPGSVGPILPDITVEIVDPGTLDVLPIGQEGEITVSGPTVVQENDSEQSSLNKFTPRSYYRTGDIGKVVDNGSKWLFVTGRIKDVINRGGETIAPGEIETVLSSYPAWQNDAMNPQIMAFAQSHEQLGQDVALAIAPQTIDIDFDKLSAWASQHLAASMLPKTFFLLPELPRSSTGKLQRARFAQHINQSLPQAELGKLLVYTLETTDAKPRLLHELTNHIEETSSSNQSEATLESLLAIVRDFVDRDITITPETRFEDAGVNSLASVELSDRLSRHFAIQLRPWIISDYPTPKTLFTHLRNLLGTPARKHSEPIQNADSTPLQPDKLDRPIRILLLHGEGADSDLMKLNMQATHWIGLLENLVEFIFIDAPHNCDPKPEFHPNAVDAALYTKSSYKSWGVTHPSTLEESISNVIETLDKHGPIDGIGGICDGGLVAALVASRRADVKLYINIASNPLSRLPQSTVDAKWTIACNTLHLISPQDEFSSIEELLEISTRCRRSLVIQHCNGHSIPPLNAKLKREVILLLKDIGLDDNGKETFKDLEAPLTTNSQWERLPLVESLLLSHKSVESAAVVQERAAKGSSSKIYAFIVLDQVTTKLPPNLKAFLSEKLSDKDSPDLLVPVEHIPLNEEQEVDYYLLSKKIPRVKAAYVGPRNQLEKDLVVIWQKLLLMDSEPGIDDDFFALGGYSLLSVILLQELEALVGEQVPQRLLVNLSTIRELAEALEGKNESRNSQPTQIERTTFEILNKSGLASNILDGLLAHTASWSGKKIRSESLIFGINTEAAGLPIFWSCQGYAEFSQLAKHLGSEQAIYGMRSGHLVMESVHSNVESLGKYYAEEIISIQPEGPYLIGGNCKSAKIAFQIAHQLQIQGKYVALLCLMEQAVPLAYSGQVALLFGDSSDRSPINYFLQPEKSWQAFYDGPTTVNSISGEHGRFFNEPNVQTLATQVQAAIDRVKNLDRDLETANIPKPLLPAKARVAKIEAPKTIFVTPHEQRYAISVKITNDSSVTWPATIENGIKLGYWVYIEKVKPPIFYGLGSALPNDVAPGESVTLTLELMLPFKPGHYRIEIDLIDNLSRWFQFDDSPTATINLHTHWSNRLPGAKHVNNFSRQTSLMVRKIKRRLT